MPERKDKPESAAVHVRLPATQYDQIYTKANQAGLTVPAWIRQALRYQLVPKPPRKP